MNAKTCLGEVDKRNKVLHAAPAISGVPRSTPENLRLLWRPKGPKLERMLPGCATSHVLSLSW